METNDKIKRILDNRESKLIETINTLDPERMYAIGHYIGYKESEYINIIEEQEEQIKENYKSIDVLKLEKNFLEDKIKYTIKILKNEDGTIPDYRIIEEAIECLGE